MSEVLEAKPKLADPSDETEPTFLSLLHVSVLDGTTGRFHELRFNEYGNPVLGFWAPEKNRHKAVRAALEAMIDALEKYKDR